MPTCNPCWALPGLTDVVAARGFLNLLQQPDTLFFYQADGEEGFPSNLSTNWMRGHGVSISPVVAAARMPNPALTSYHRSLGLGPERILCPSSGGRLPVAESFLQHPNDLARLASDRSVKRVFFAFKDPQSQQLGDHLGWDQVGCEPPPSVYQTANDKRRLSESAAAHGLFTLPALTATDSPSLQNAFLTLNRIYNQGCMLRMCHGACGHELHHARSPAHARLIGLRLLARGNIVVTPFVPPERIQRNLALHGWMTPEGFAPITLTEQILRGFQYRGGRLADNLEPDELRAVRSILPGLGSWLKSEGYVNAPAGVDGFLLKTPEGPRFTLIDPNIRLTGSMRPWSVGAILGERTGSQFLWQSEWFAFLGPLPTFDQFCRRLDPFLLQPGRIGDGGILPSSFGSIGTRPLGVLMVEVLLLARDLKHLRHLRAHVLGSGLTLSPGREIP